MKNLRKEFPVLQQYTYLNTASSGLLYDSLLDFRQDHDLDFLIKGSLFRDRQQESLNEVRTTIAQTFDSLSENTVLTQNFSLGLNTILNGLDKSQKVLLLDEDYPSVNFAFTSKGFETCYTTIDENLERNIEQAIRNNKPNIFAFSLVQYISGIAIDMGFLKTLKAKYPELLIIADGTQFCGTKMFSFKQSGIDILGCSGYKWLLGGYGNGFILFQDQILEKITPKIYLETAKQNDYDDSYTNLKARFECGHLDTYSFGSLKFSLQYLQSIGFEFIEKQHEELIRYAKKEFTKRDLLEKSVTQRKTHSTIFNLKGNYALFNTLKKKDIITSLRGQGLRVSFHFYNTLDDLEKLLLHL